MPTLAVIIGSTRPGRAGLPIAVWFIERARRHGGFEVEVADLAELNLPLLDEPNHPRRQEYVHQHTKDWSAFVDHADAVVFVTSEYNYGYSAPLKNAIDYLHNEWMGKPAGFVSYGGISAGTRAVQQLKQVVAVLKMMPVVESVNIPFHTNFIKDGRVQANEVMEQAADAMLDELVRVEAALRPLRKPALAAAAPTRVVTAASDGDQAR
ncbi:MULTISPECIES: NADPH-dependent FMN reductase [unclassified Pseudofrankia]|uniref:NADPH-dependent FMN reductase n=1 Tax=unclassified Pseudofrankia TaxID=2994372 RepID=UPI0008DB0F12|nr:MULTISPECIES: NAD(P)H-dependent oxidoreductase [unclassified Pseudofrankia]MDT3442173.1 NAD(P)H-dependent oxidoreductase [Pseudofrankia sp. BMG5.37]OHV43608.1 NADPH-dependent FMN reductase [Pseudofrankia sp. BMG5.36]